MRISGDQRLVGEAPAFDRLKGATEARSVCRLARVETEHGLVNVSLKVERSRGDICPFERPLEHRPQSLHVIDVRPAANVLVSVVNPFGQRYLHSALA